MRPRPLLTPLRRIPTLKGDVLHGMKIGDPGYAGIAEAYFSTVHPRTVKGWKRHHEMTLNLICIQGAIRFVVHDGGETAQPPFDVTLSPDQGELYQRLTVPPGLWVGFEGIGAGSNMLVNLASRAHDPAEAENVDLAKFEWPHRCELRA